MRAECWLWMKLLAGKSPFLLPSLTWPCVPTLTRLNSIDTETDIKIQSLINKEFCNHTVISVAHRLETIAGFDFVGVMDGGKLVEYGDPQVLLQKEDSRFGELWGER
jgi:ABC-type transport system involved in Fe-S cluster assembly fused permease/ATPase subunit